MVPVSKEFAMAASNCAWVATSVDGPEALHWASTAQPAMRNRRYLHQNEAPRGLRSLFYLANAEAPREELEAPTATSSEELFQTHWLLIHWFRSRIVPIPEYSPLDSPLNMMDFPTKRIEAYL
jgi:hypothetical protein